jgi:hypothetical protein
MVPGLLPELADKIDASQKAMVTIQRIHPPICKRDQSVGRGADSPNAGKPSVLAAKVRRPRLLLRRLGCAPVIKAAVSAETVTFGCSAESFDKQPSRSTASFPRPACDQDLF